MDGRPLGPGQVQVLGVEFDWPGQRPSLAAVGEFDANTEWLTAGNLDFLEVSIRSESGAEPSQQRLEAAIRAGTDCR